MAVRKANARRPQVLVFTVDDSNSMAEKRAGGKTKAEIVSERLEALLHTIEMDNAQSTGYRYLVSVIKFGDNPEVICENAKPSDFMRLDLFGAKLKFKGTSGGTEMAQALNVTRSVLRRGIAEITTVPGFDLTSTPYPLVLFFSDGENTGPNPMDAAKELHDVTFSDGKVVVVACGIGQGAHEFESMKFIATSPELAINLDVDAVGSFIAIAGNTIINPRADLVQELKGNIRAQADKR